VADWHYRLGKIYAARGNRLGALAELERAVLLAEGEKRTYSWLFDAYFLLGDAMRASGAKDKAISYYWRYLELAPPDNAYRPDVERALQSLGAAQPR
jgi:tetratricopeptide (TPR) repeat protein